MTLLTAAVLIEEWKLPVFSRHLREAGYSYDTAGGLIDGTITLRVSFDDVVKLKSIIETANKECMK